MEAENGLVTNTSH